MFVSVSVILFVNILCKFWSMPVFKNNETENWTHDWLWWLCVNLLLHRTVCTETLLLEFIQIICWDLCYCYLVPLPVLIIIMEICKAPTLRLKALDKHSIAHIMYVKMEMLSAIKMYIRKKKKLTHNVDKSLKALNALQYKTVIQKMHTHTHTHARTHSRTHARTHARTHTHCTDW